MKQALITGASSGIGHATAIKFHEAGYFVHLLARDQNRLSELHKQLPNSKVIACDLSSPQQIQNLPNVIDLSKIDVLVNNAGIFFVKPNEETSLSDWQLMFQVNVYAPAQLSALLFPHFKHNKSGAIVMVASTLAHKPTANTGAYSASKAALQNLTMSLALEGAPANIRVNCVSPGIVETPIHGLNDLTAEQRKQKIDTLNKLQPLARMGKPSDIAQAILFLGSEQSSWTTGTILNVDGGINIA